METAQHASNSGMTFNITRNKKYRSSGRLDSPDIENLSVEVIYHSADMLQFKVCLVFIYVCVCFLLICLQLRAEVGIKTKL